MRILLFSGKGGVGKTSTAAATGLKLASLGYRTLVMSVDPAHSLSDAFDLEAGLFSSRTADPVPIVANLEIHEVNIQKEIKRHWNEISTYIIGLLRTSGLADVEAEELAIFPGMEELSAMMYVNQFRREGRYDVIVLDCAPTAESLRFISMPTTLEWYIKHIFPTERKLLKLMRPLANRVSPVELPQDSYFANIYDLYKKIEGIDTLLADPVKTSARLVTNAEKMVLKETQRAFVYFSLHGLTVDEIIVNRLLPEEAGQGFFAEARRNQQEVLAEVERYFAPVPARRVPLFETEVLGIERLRRLADVLYGAGEDPAAVTRTEPAYEFGKKDDHYEVRLRLPFAAKSEVGLYKKGDELVVEIGNFRRHVGLPTSMAALAPVRARLEDRLLIVEMKEAA
ncbi:MAG: TRC40/GET3/ArsA family transport-energizing ATPase [Bryobacteraceae bacterium]|nr:TRC40/GET3/ArsA family transport-energizing ATPase [Bryobacteraceae bacterium]